MDSALPKKQIRITSSEKKNRFGFGSSREIKLSANSNDPDPEAKWTGYEIGRTSDPYLRLDTGCPVSYPINLN